MAHRYWQLTLTDVQSGTLGLSELQLWCDGARVDGSATITASLAPTTGALSNISDNNLATQAEWAIGSVRFTWDFGSSTDVGRVYIGASSDTSDFPRSYTLQYSDDGVEWNPLMIADSIGVPAANASVLVGGYMAARAAAIQVWSGADGSKYLYDDGGAGIVLSGTAGLKDGAPPALGSRAIDLTANGNTLTFPSDPKYAIGSGNFDFSIEVYLTGYPTASPGPIYRSSLITRDVNGMRSFSWDLVGTASSITSMEILIFNSSGLHTTSSVAFTFSLNTKYLLRVRRVSGVVTFFIDGVQVGSPQSNTEVSPSYTNGIVIGRTSYGGGYDYQLYAWVGRVLMLIGATLDRGASTDDLLHNRVGMGPRAFVTKLLGRAISFASSPSPLPITAKLVKTIKSWRDMVFAGNGRIAGTTEIDGTPDDVPTRRKVRLHRDIDGMMIRETWSDPITGAWEFKEIDSSYRYTVVTYDYQHNYRAVIADNIQPEVV